MPKDNVIVGLVEFVLAPASFTGSLPRPGVRFQDGREAYFELPASDRTSRQIRILDTLQRIEWPAHVELKGLQMAAVRIPEVGFVRSMDQTELPDVLEVVLDSCETRFLIDAAADPDNVAFLRSALRTVVPVAVVEGDDQTIFDVQPLTTGILSENPRFRPVRSGSAVIEATTIFDSVSRVDALYDAAAALGCMLPDAQELCVPYLYARRGCWAAAHRICEELAAATPPVVAAKIWHFGRLVVKTPNEATCAVRWAWHVAPFVRLARNARVELRVIDPSLFDHGSVSSERWLERQGGGTRIIAHSDAEVYLLDDGPGLGRLQKPATVSTLSENDRDLLRYRRLLLEIAPGKPSPPPYQNCLPSSLVIPT